MRYHNTNSSDHHDSSDNRCNSYRLDNTEIGRGVHGDGGVLILGSLEVVEVVEEEAVRWRSVGVRRSMLVLMGGKEGGGGVGRKEVR